MRLSRIHRNGWGAGVVSLLMDVSSEMIYPLVPLFLASSLGASKQVIGLIEGIAEAMAALLKAYSGALADRFRRYRLLMALGYGLSTLARPLLAVSGSWASVLGARFVDRFVKGVRTAPRDAIIAAAAERASLGFSFGFHRAMDTMGAVLGPAAAWLLLSYAPGDYRLLFWLATIPAVVAVAAIFLLVREAPGIRAGSRPPLSFRGLPAQAYGFTAVAGLFSLGNSSDVFLVLRTENCGIPAGLVPVVYLGFNVVYALLATPAGALADRLGRRRVVQLGFPLFAAMYAGFAMADAAWHVAALFAMYGVFMALTEGVHKAFLAEILPLERRATGFGMFHMVVSLATLPASLVAGLLWDEVDPSDPFWYGAAMAAVAAIALPWFVPSMPPRGSMGMP